MFLSTFSFSAIDDCKTDVYFGNGILTEEEAAENNAKLLSVAIKKKFYNGKTSEMKKYIGKVDYAYNSTFVSFHLSSGVTHSLVQTEKEL